MSTVRRHTRITAKGRRVTVRQHEREDGQAGGSGLTALSYDPYASASTGGASPGDVITNGAEGASGPMTDTGPSPYGPGEIARREQFAYACEVLGYSPADVMNMPAVRDRIMRAIG
jgi:hypothetical protein